MLGAVQPQQQGQANQTGQAQPVPGVPDLSRIIPGVMQAMTNPQGASVSSLCRYSTYILGAQSDR